MKSELFVVLLSLGAVCLAVAYLRLSMKLNKLIGDLKLLLRVTHMQNEYFGQVGMVMKTIDGHHKNMVDAFTEFNKSMEKALYGPQHPEPPKKKKTPKLTVIPTETLKK